MLFNPAGGLRYHLRAALSHERWAPFRAGVSRWLETQWNPSERRLVIVGPSGGYCLEPSFLERFEEIVCIDPDPLAELIFKLRLPRPLARRVRWIRGDAFEQEIPNQGYALLFSNFLGQLSVIHEEEAELSARKRRVTALLASRAGSWASFHDRVSGPVAPELPREGVRESRRLSDAEIIERFYQRTSGARVELVDHRTEGLFEASRTHDYFAWALRPGQHHLIEATRRP